MSRSPKIAILSSDGGLNDDASAEQGSSLKTKGISRQDTQGELHEKAKGANGSPNDMNDVVEAAVAASALAWKNDKRATAALEAMLNTSATAQRAVTKVAELVAEKSLGEVFDEETAEQAKRMAMHAIEMVEKACAEAEEAHILAEDSSTEAQLAWNKAVSANKIRAEYEAAAARARADATRTMEEASTKAEEDAALRPSSEANAKAFLAKAAFARVTAAKALSETAAKSRIDATLSMMQAATDAGALAAAQSAARKAVEVVITCWELVAKLNAGKAIARAAAAARDASMLANKVLEEAEADTVKARQAALDAAARVVAAKSKAARMTTGRRTAEDAAEKAAAVRLSRPGVEAVKQEADAAVATLAAEEAAAKEVEAESIMELKAAASSRKVAEQAKSVWEQAARVAQETFDKKLELERDKAARVELMKATEVLAAEKNLVLAELDAKAEVARKAARGGAKSGKAIAERTEYESRKADFTANKAREIATVVNNEVQAHQAAINSFDEKIADVMVEYAALTANTDSLLLEANRLDADACELEAIADKANQAAKRARQKARDAHERKEMLARSVVEEYDAMIQDQKDAVDLAAAIREAQSLEQAALEELHKEEKMAHSLSETYQELEQLRKAADLDARQKAPLALNAAADEKGEGRMKLEAVKSANTAGQKAMTAVALSSRAAVKAEASTAQAMEAHQTASAHAALARTKDDRNATRASPTEAKWCRLSGDGLRRGTLGTPTQFTIEAFDETGSQQPDGGDTFLVCIRCTSQGTRIHARITDNGDGTYTVRFKPITWGACTVSVSLLKSHGIFGEPLPGSPFQCYISGVTPSASQCSVKPPMAPAIACVPTHFYVSFRDERGELAHATKSELEVCVQHEEVYNECGLPLAWRPSPRSMWIPPHVEGLSPRLDALSKIQEETQEGAVGTLTARSASSQGYGAPRVNTSPRKDIELWSRRVALDSERERARARERDELYEQASGGRNLSPLRARALVKLPSLHLQDLGMDPEHIGFAYGGIEGGERHQQLQEEYKVAFSVAAAGEYVLHVRLRQNNCKPGDGTIPGSPLFFTVEPGKPYALSTQVPVAELPLCGQYMELKTPSAPQDHGPISFYEALVKKAGINALSRGNTTLISSAPSVPEPPPAQAMKSASQEASQNSFALGRSFKMSGDALSASRDSFKRPVTPTNASIAELLAVMAPAVPTLAAPAATTAPPEVKDSEWKGYVCTFCLQTRDKAGNDCKTGGGNVTCGVASASTDVESSCIDLRDGKYQLTWRSSIPQTDVLVFVRIDGIHILGSPLSLDLDGGLQTMQVVEQKAPSPRKKKSPKKIVSPDGKDGFGKSGSQKNERKLSPKASAAKLAAEKAAAEKAAAEKAAAEKAAAEKAEAERLAAEAAAAAAAAEAEALAAEAAAAARAARKAAKKGAKK